MDAKSLMIGDWVEIQDTPKYYKVFGIDILAKGDACRLTFEDYVVDTWCDKVKPITITEEILKANGFLTNNDRTLNGCCIYHRLCGKYDEYKVTIKLLNGFITIESFDDRWYTLLNLNIQPRFVHELQRILRCCGLWELADNLKIE